MEIYNGVHIDIGGPLRASDLEMSRGHKDAFEKRGLIYTLEPMETWQLYGVISKGYAGFMRGALSLSRSGKKLKDFIDFENPAAEIENVAVNYIKPEEDDIIISMAAESEKTYNANPSKRLNKGAIEGLNLLKVYKIPMSIVTESLAEGTRKWIKNPEINLAEYFPDDMVFGKDSTGQGVKNPKVELLRKSAEKMNKNIKNTIYIADTVGDIKAAREAGCSIGVITIGMTPVEILHRNSPNFVFETLEDASKYIVGLCD